MIHDLHVVGDEAVAIDRETQTFYCDEIEYSNVLWQGSSLFVGPHSIQRVYHPLNALVLQVMDERHPDCNVCVKDFVYNLLREFIQKWKGGFVSPD